MSLTASETLSPKVYLGEERRRASCSVVKPDACWPVASQGYGHGLRRRSRRSRRAGFWAATARLRSTVVHAAHRSTPPSRISCSRSRSPGWPWMQPAPANRSRTRGSKRVHNVPRPACRASCGSEVHSPWSRGIQKHYDSDRETCEIHLTAEPGTSTHRSLRELKR